MTVRFDIRFAQQQANHVWTVDASGQNALIYASTAFLLLVQATAKLPEQVPKRQRMEREKRPRSVDTEEDDSASEAQLLGLKDDQSEPEADLSGSEYDPLEFHDYSGSDEEHSDKDGSRGTGTGSPNGGVSSGGDGSGSSIDISGWNGSESSVTCGRSGLSMSRGLSASGSGSGRKTDLSGSEYGPLDSDDEDRLNRAGLQWEEQRKQQWEQQREHGYHEGGSMQYARSSRPRQTRPPPLLAPRPSRARPSRLHVLVLHVLILHRPSNARPSRVV